MSIHNYLFSESIHGLIHSLVFRDSDSIMLFFVHSHEFIIISGLLENNIVLGKHSGRHAFRIRLVELGYTVSDDEINRAFIRFKELADKKKDISNADLESIVNDELQTVAQDRFKLVRIQVLCGDQQIPTATATILDQESGQESTTACTGTGPVDAAFKAIRVQTPGAESINLLEYTVSSVTAGIDALGEVTVRLQDSQSSRIAFGKAAETDVIVASAQAYLNAINRLISMRSDVPLNPQFVSV
jgi:2-isopropylmalate synthase